MADLLSHQNMRNVGDQSNMNLNCGLEFGFWEVCGFKMKFGQKSTIIWNFWILVPMYIVYII